MVVVVVVVAVVVFGDAVVEEEDVVDPVAVKAGQVLRSGICCWGHPLAV